MTIGKRKLSLPTEGRLGQLDKIVPLISLGLVAYVAGKAAADKRAAARELTRIGAATPVALEAAPSLAETGIRGLRSRTKSMSRTRQVLFLMLLIGIVVMVAGGGTFATFSAETSNPGSQVASGTLTMSDQVNSASACLSKDALTLDNYKETCDPIVLLSNEAPGVADTSGTYAGGYAKVTIANTGSINASLFSLYAPLVNSKLTSPISTGATVAQATTTLNGAITSGTSPITVNSFAGFPTSGNFTILVDNEEMTVTAGQGTTSWTVTRGANGTTAAAHSNSATVSLVTNLAVSAMEGPVAAGDVITLTANGASQTFCAGANAAGGATTLVISGGYPLGTTGSCPASSPSTTLNGAINGTTTSIVVNSASGFPTSGTYVIDVDNEQMLVTGGQGTTTWTVVRGFNGTSAVSHLTAATVGTGPVLAGSNFIANTFVADTSSDTIGAPSTVLAANVTSTSATTITVPAGFSTDFPQAGTFTPFTIQVDSEQMRVTAQSASPYTTWTVTRGYNGTTAATHNANATVSALPNTDCFDAQTGNAYQVNGSSYGSQLNFNAPTLDPLCTSALLWVQEATTISSTTYYYCWFGRGSTLGDQTTHTNGSGQDANEDSSGQCRTPTSMVLASSVTAGSTSYSTIDVGTLNGNIRNGDTIKFTENGNTMTCVSSADYYIGMNTHTSNLTFNGCSGGSGQLFDASAVVKDQSSFDDLNTTNSKSTLANFDTAHHTNKGQITLAPIQTTANRVANAANNPVAELGKSGTIGLAGTYPPTAIAPAIRTFYVGVYIPAGSGNAQNAIQGLVSTFGLTWHIDQ